MYELTLHFTEAEKLHLISALARVGYTLETAETYFKMVIANMLEKGGTPP